MRRTETEWAIRNLELAGFFTPESDYGGMIGEAVKKLLLMHSAEGHSGASHTQTVNVFAHVAKGQPLTQQFWDERFAEYNELAKEMGGNPWTVESFEEIVMKRPKS